MIVLWLRGGGCFSRFKKALLVSREQVERNAPNVRKRPTSPTLKEQCHEDFALSGQFCAKIITLTLQS